LFEGGGGDDRVVPIASVSYDPATHEAVLTIDPASAPLADDRYRIVVEGNDPAHALQDLAGNALGGGVDAVSDFAVDTTASATVTLSDNILWPPNHKMATITAQIVAEPGSTVTLLSVTSSEPDSGLGDGDTANDIQGVSLGTDDRSFQVRRERSGT